MKLSKHGKITLVSVENVSPFGIWIFVNGREYPYSKNQSLKSIQNVNLLHGYHLYWPELEIDLEIANLINPEKYTLKAKNTFTV